ncbi:hypothetical protein THAOC_13711, partial [Thalassiosira oceanica]
VGSAPATAVGFAPAPRGFALATAWIRSRTREDSLAQPLRVKERHTPDIENKDDRAGLRQGLNHSAVPNSRFGLTSSETQRTERAADNQGLKGDDENGSKVRFFLGYLEKKVCLRPEETVSDWHISHDHLGHAKA